jgi:hypothetical protein
MPSWRSSPGRSAWSPASPRSTSAARYRSLAFLGFAVIAIGQYLADPCGHLSRCSGFKVFFCRLLGVEVMGLCVSCTWSLYFGLDRNGNLVVVVYMQISFWLSYGGEKCVGGWVPPRIDCAKFPTQ